MDEKQFQKLLGQVGEFSPAQFKTLVQVYAGQNGQDDKRVWNNAVYSTSEQRLIAIGVNRTCPNCGSAAVVHNGVSKAGIQHLRCQDCGRNFTRFTGTLLEKSRFPWEVWVEVLRMTLNDDSILEPVFIYFRSRFSVADWTSKPSRAICLVAHCGYTSYCWPHSASSTRLRPVIMLKSESFSYYNVSIIRNNIVAPIVINR